MKNLEQDCRNRAAQCERYAEEHRRDGQEMSRQFHLGAAMAFAETADRIAGGVEGSDRTQTETTPSRASQPSDVGERQDPREVPDLKGCER